uniref:Cyclin-like domain-containing protein n=1 Tax=Anopheles dirus TaxID=7168 RepID=A0A182N7S4_9DIPT
MASGGSASGTTTTSKNDDSKWYFTAEQLASSPSRKCGMDADQELMYRQRAANLVQDMGQRLQVSQLCINTAIVYMHRFYAFHSFTQFHRNSIAAAALFLAAKVEEQPRKLEHIIKVVHICLGLEAPDPMRENYAEQAQDLVFNENVLLQTLGFDVAIDHPHTHVVKTCHLVKASKDLAQTSYFMASNSLHLTTMCLQYKPTVVACFCIHLACKWSRWEIPQSNEGRHWFHYVDKTVTLDLLKQLTDEFLHIFDRCPTRLKSKMKSMRADPGAEESGRRAGGSSSSSSASLMAAPSSSSSVPRGLDEGGSSTASSATSHHRSKQGSISDMMKQHGMSSSSGSHQKLTSSSGSSSSSGSRSRSERPSVGLPGAQQQQQQHKGPPTHRTSMQQPTSASLPLNATNTSSSSSAQRSSSQGYQGHEGGKSRQPPSGAAVGPSSGTSSSSMHSGYSQSKAESRHSSSSSSTSGGQKLPPKPHSSSSSSSAAGAGAAPLYNTKHQPQQPAQPSSLFSHPPSYNQSISGRGSSLPLAADQQTASSGSAPGAGTNQPKTEPSSFRLLDESIGRLPDPMQMCTPPKQSKPSSIFSPDYKDAQSESLQSVPASKSRSSSHFGGSGAGAGGPDRLLKPPKGSPSGKKQQHQQQHHAGSRSQDAQKKERRMESLAGQAPSSGKHPAALLSHDGKKSLLPPGSSSSSSNSSNANNSNSHIGSHGLKRMLDGTIVPSAMANETGNGASAAPGSASATSLLSSQVAKRPNPNGAEQVRQEDGTDFREQKMRRTAEPPPPPPSTSSASFLSGGGGSPSDQLFNSSFDLASTFDKMDDSSSLFNFNDPGSLLSQPLLSDSKPPLPLAKSGGIFSNTINGVETNAAFVSSLLKESLFSETPKFGSLYGGTSTSTGDGSGVPPPTSAIDTKPGDTIVPAPAPTQSQPLIDTKPQIASIDSLLSNPAPPAPGQQQSGVPGDASQQGIAPPSYPWAAPSGTQPSESSVVAGAAPVNVHPVPPQTTADPTALATTTTASTASDPDTDQGGHRSKSEKKKKKEKHKNKDKEKSKDRGDREEKKKHKKDKDKHRDREHRDHREKGDHHRVGASGDGSSATGGGQAVPPGPIKIKLNRAIIPPVVEGVGGGGPANDGLKIKIPKDRLSGSSTLPGGPVGGASHASGAAAAPAPPAASASLKLKISKDKIEHYNISATSDPIGGGIGPHHSSGGIAGVGPTGSGGVLGIGGGATGGSSGGSSKKKDKERDKERDKSKSKSSSSNLSSDHANRQNGSGAMNAGNSSSKSSSKVFTCLI